MEHLKLANLMDTDEIDWITNLLLVNQSYHLIHHYNYMKRNSYGKLEKYERVQQMMERERLSILNELLSIKKTTTEKSGNASEIADGTQPKKRGRKPKAKLPSVMDFLEKEIK